MASQINLSLLKLAKRAETSAPEVLVTAFVDTGMLSALLTSKDHQVIFGRRGTGKTHALLYLSERRRVVGDLTIYIDLRNVGSSTGIFSDDSVPLSERGTRLLRDVLAQIHERLFEYAAQSDVLNLGEVGPYLDAFIDAATHTEVVGTAETGSVSVHASSDTAAGSIGMGISSSGITVGAAGASSQTQSEGTRASERQSGVRRHHVNFGAIGQILEKIAGSISPKRVWLLLDEWSAVPLDLQPYLADLIRRCILPVPGVTVKFGAIEQRTQFKLSGKRGDYTGIEIGADVTADLNLDDFMVFDNDSSKAVRFFRRLIFNHYRAIRLQDDGVTVGGSDEDFSRESFTQKNALEELVRAAEGVPRDAINIVSLCAQRAGDAQISVGHVRNAARTWYQRDKEASVSANEEANALLHWIVDEVIAHRRARAFLLLGGIRYPLIETLFDARVLHVLKHNISSPDQPGVRYEVYKIDYGCYVGLLTTDKEPGGLLPADDGSGGEVFVDVPPDDYRAIRRAILDMRIFRESRTAELKTGGGSPAT